MESRLFPYCAECSIQLGHPGRYAVVVANAQQHARITSHVVQVVDELSHAVVESVAGEPSLPLWD